MNEKENRIDWFYVLLGIIFLTSKLIVGDKLETKYGVDDSHFASGTLAVSKITRNSATSDFDSQYKIETTNYKASFIIPKGSIDSSSVKKINRINEGDSLQVLIYQKDVKNVQVKNSEILIYSLKIKHTQVFDYDWLKKIKKRRIDYIFIFLFAFGLYHLLIGFSIISSKTGFILFSSFVIIFLLVIVDFRLSSFDFVKSTKFIGFAIFICFLLVVYFIIFKILPKIALKTKDKKNEHRIENITKDGFQFFDRRNQVNIEWKTITKLEIELPEIYTDDLILDANIKITLNDNREFYVMNYCEGHLKFLKNVPPGFEHFDYNLINTLFSSLKSCKICGLYSMYRGSCLNCDYSTKDDRIYLRENKGESIKTFYKEEQLDYLTTYFDNNESVSVTLNKAKQNELFEINENWIIYPTIQEIQEEKDKWKKK